METKNVGLWRGQGKKWRPFEPEEEGGLPDFVTDACTNNLRIPLPLLDVLPRHDMSISQLITSKLPLLSSTSHAGLTFHSDNVKLTTRDLDRFRQMDGPHPTLIESAYKSIEQLWLDGSNSLKWEGHLWPLWAVSFWWLLLEIRTQSGAWKYGISWMGDQVRKLKATGDELKNFKNTTIRVRSLLEKISWSGNLAGFGLQSTPIALTARFLSDNWLTDLHIPLELHLMQIHLQENDPLSSCIVRPPRFGTQILEAYTQRDSTLYATQSTETFEPKRFGTQLADGDLEAVGCVVHCGGNHWVGVLVDFLNHTLGFADPMGPKNLERYQIREAFTWWAGQHSSQPFRIVDLPCTIQRDSFSCGLLSANAVGHRLMKTPLIPAKDVALARMTTLIAILERHLDLYGSSATADPYSGQFNEWSPAQTPPQSTIKSEPPAEAPASSPPATSKTRTKTLVSLLDSFKITRPPSPLSATPPKPSQSESSPQVLPQPTEPAKSSSSRKSASTAGASKSKPPANKKPLLKLPSMRTMKQSTLKLVKMTKGEIAETKRIVDEKLELVRAGAKAMDDRREARALEKKREKDKLRKQKSREGIKARRIEEGTQLVKDTAKESTRQRANKSALDSRRRLADRFEKQRETKQKKRKRSNMTYQNPHVWCYVEQAVTRVGWDHKSISKHIKMNDPSNLFTRVKSSLVKTWINQETLNSWTPLVLARVQLKGPIGQKGRSQILAPYPELLSSILRHLSALRTTGVPISVPIARAIITGHIRSQQPTLLPKFRVSSTWIRRFLSLQLAWSYRVGTRATRKRPKDWDEQCERMLFRLAYIILTRKIRHPDLIINYDHAGHSLVPMSKMTWSTKGAKQVDIQVKGDKRQMTLVVGSTPSGTLLPFQSIWGGATGNKISLPSADAHKRREADAAGMKFTHGDNRHWASLTTSKEYVDQIVVEHLKRVIDEHRLDKETYSVLIIDCWPTHTASGAGSFLSWLKKKHPKIIPLFIPAGCTGEFQPADVGLQWILKQLVRQAASDFFISYTTNELAAGVEPENILLPIDIKTLRDASVAWQMQAWETVKNQPEKVQDAWKRCTAKGRDLSWECLTSDETRAALMTYMAEHPDFAQEVGAISNGQTAIPVSEEFPGEGDGESFEVNAADEGRAPVLQVEAPSDAEGSGSTVKPEEDQLPSDDESEADEDEFDAIFDEDVADAGLAGVAKRSKPQPLSEAEEDCLSSDSNSSDAENTSETSGTDGITGGDLDELNVDQDNISFMSTSGYSQSDPSVDPYSTDQDITMNQSGASDQDHKGIDVDMDLDGTRYKDSSDDDDGDIFSGRSPETEDHTAPDPQPPSDPVKTTFPMDITLLGDVHPLALNKFGAKAAPKKRGRKRKAEETETDAAVASLDEADNEGVPAKKKAKGPKKPGRKSKARKKPLVVESEDENDVVSEEEIAFVPVAQTRRGREVIKTEKVGGKSRV